MDRKIVCLVLGSLLVAMLVAPLRPVEAQDVDVPGNLTMRDSADSTVGNVLKEGVPFIHNFGTNNTFVGKNAGNLTMTGDNNTAMGDDALRSNTTGSLNTAMGNDALISNTTGSFNTAFGDSALLSNTTGSNNIAIGRWALLNNTTGNLNTASGVQALFFNTTGSQNTAIGHTALLNNTTGTSNTTIGLSALAINTTGNGNTAIGLSALVNNATGGGNTASGINALLSNRTGNGNTASGAGALFRNTTGSLNTAIGAGADVCNSFFFPDCGDLTNATAIGAGAIVDASNKIRLGDTAVTVIEGQVPYTFTSDKTKKENFKSVDGEEVLRKISRLSLTSWNYIGHDPKQFRHYGPVAQDFFAAFGDDGIGTIGTPTTINSGDMAGILMIAVKALERRTAEQGLELEKKTRELEAKNRVINDLSQRLEAMERLVKGTQTAMRESTK